MKNKTEQGSGRACEWSWMGQVDYEAALKMQEARVKARQNGEAEDRLFLLEHLPVITLGRSAGRGNLRVPEPLLAQRSVKVFETGRGGDVTFHGPGQVVGYPIIDLKPDRRDVHRYVRDLEEVLIRTAAGYGLPALRVPGLTGVWVGREKLAAIGVRISRWVTSHGFAFNVTTDLSYFDLIVPCGIAHRGVTSLEKLLERSVPLPEVAGRMARHFGEVYGRKMIRSAPGRPSVPGPPSHRCRPS